jgi:hypothetical protein
LDQPGVRLRVWFERRGFDDHGFISYDSKRAEVDPGIMARQGRLNAGPLRGVLEIQNPPDSQLDAVRKNLIGSAEYIDLAKHIIKLLSPRLSRLIRILRTNYGQYWLNESADWDSRAESLGSYCSRLALGWSLDGNTWALFQPEISSISIVAPKIPFGEFLTEEDWNELGQVFAEGYDPPLASMLLSRTNQLLCEGNLRYAFVEGVSALEVGLQAYMKTHIGALQGAATAMSAFWNLPLNAQFLSVAVVARVGEPKDLADTLEAIDLRNRIVHEGWDPPESTKAKVLALMRTTAGLLPGPKFKFPVHNLSGNKVYAPEKAADQLTQHGS